MLIQCGEPGARLIKLPPIRLQALLNSWPFIGAIVKHCIPRIRMRSASNCKVKVLPAPLVPMRFKFAFLFFLVLNKSIIQSELLCLFTPTRTPESSDISKLVNINVDAAPLVSIFRFERLSIVGDILRKGIADFSACSCRNRQSET